ncbi:hypothetical protein PG994_007006 [Apiospora phragmitis]|uniref:Uncharacterized protein n=1 Tax=Apiospora phragmitis TaxID=2905665 RepID=A0ABR1V2X5_9PEZI
MCYHPEVLWGCGFRETANGTLERCGGAIAYGIDCIGIMPAPDYRTLQITIPCLDCRSKHKRVSQRGGARKSTRVLKRMTACF